MLPTPRTTLGHAAFAAICNACDRCADVDLGLLIERGLGDVPLVKLRLRCSACGSRDVCGRVAGIAPGYEVKD